MIRSSSLRFSTIRSSSAGPARPNDPGPPLLKIASWNVNSIRARIEHVKRWLSLRNPDVLLMQELKGEVFPAEMFEPLGYHSVAVTQKTYNGVAILSRSPIQVTCTTLAGDAEDT